jgi:hypothetical protein
MPATQPKADASDPAATAQQPSGIQAIPNKAVDAAVKADALPAPLALDAAATLEAAKQAGVGIAAQSIGETFDLQMALPPAATAPSKGDSIQPTGKSVQKNAADAVGTKNSNAVTTTDTVQAKVADSSGTAGDASSHNSQSNGQPAQHSQPDSSQSVVAMPKVVDSGAVQPQAVPAAAVSHEAAISAGATSGIQDGSHQGLERSDTSSSALDGDEVTAATGINAAKLVQTMSETEMRVGLHSNEFGAISIRTSVSQQQMLAQISLDHAGLSQAISAHISSMQTKLGNDSGLDTLIQVNHEAASTTGQGNSQQRERRASAPSVSAEGAVVPADPDVGLSPVVLAGTSSGYRLDIRA